MGEGEVTIVGGGHPPAPLRREDQVPTTASLALRNRSDLFDYSDRTVTTGRCRVHGASAARQRGEMIAGPVVGQVDIPLPGDHDEAFALQPVDGGSPAVRCPGLRSSSSAWSSTTSCSRSPPMTTFPSAAAGTRFPHGTQPAVGELRQQHAASSVVPISAGMVFPLAALAVRPLCRVGSSRNAMRRTPPSDVADTAGRVGAAGGRQCALGFLGRRR
jgi:hypothetical protein